MLSASGCTMEDDALIRMEDDMVKQIDEFLDQDIPFDLFEDSDSSGPPLGILGAVSGAPGGPLSSPGFPSALIRVSSFRDSCIAILTALQAEINSLSIEAIDESDLSVDDLKIVSNEELVKYGLENVLEGNRTDTTEGCSGVEKENDSLSKLAIVSSKRRKKLGRPADSHVRGALWNEVDHLFDRTLYARLRDEREAAKANCRLLSFSASNNSGSAQARFENIRLRTSNFFAYPVKTDIIAHTNLFEEISPFEVVLWIDVRRRSKRQKAQGFLVLGSQLLTSLRDKIYCLTDEIMRKENSYVPSGYFYIENVFYNDMRDPSAIDYSLPIIDWLRKQPFSETAGFSSDSCSEAMASTQFSDLECCVGKSYVYCHQGDCKHDLIIRDMRIIHKDDIQNALLYPLVQTQSPLRRKCNICQIHAARKVTYDDKLAPQSPCFFCDYCYYMAHYSEDGNLLYDDFRVYDYYHE